jgi:hypothetical protein
MDLPLAGYTPTGGFFQVVEISSHHNVIQGEIFLRDFPPKGGPVVGGTLCVYVDYG